MIAADWATYWQHPTPAQIKQASQVYNLAGAIIQPNVIDRQLSTAAHISIEACLDLGLSVDCYLRPDWTYEGLGRWYQLYLLVTEAYGLNIARWWLDIEDDGLGKTQEMDPNTQLTGAKLFLPANTGIYFARGTVHNYLSDWQISQWGPQWIARWHTEPALRAGEAMAQYQAGVLGVDGLTVDLNVY